MRRSISGFIAFAEKKEVSCTLIRTRAVPTPHDAKNMRNRGDTGDRGHSLSYYTSNVCDPPVTILRLSRRPCTLAPSTQKSFPTSFSQCCFGVTAHACLPSTARISCWLVDNSAVDLKFSGFFNNLFF